MSRKRRSIAARLGIHCLALCLLLGLVAPTAQAASAPAIPPIISLLLSGEIPAVGITSPVSGSTLVAGDITVSAYAADADGTISKVEFFVGGTTLIGTATSAPYSITWPKVAPGQYTLSAKATDNDGETGLSAPVSIAVSATVSWQIYFVHADHLNTPRLIANSAGQTVWTWANDDPFGNNAPNENPSGLGIFTCNLRFPGQYFDKETNLHYNYFRDYDPAIGRYIQSDPIGLQGGINTYAYVDSNPLRNIDPYGLQTIILPPGGRGAAAGGAAGAAGSGGILGGAAGSTGNVGSSSAIAKGLQNLANKLFCPPECEKLQAEIAELAGELRVRYVQMTADVRNLYCTRPIGQFSWMGHVVQFSGKQKRLQNLIAQARAQNCPVNPEDERLANTPPPPCPAR